MNADARKLLCAGTVLMALSTVFGAFGVHSLKSVLSADHFETFRTGVYYQFFHSLGVLAVGLIADHRPGKLIRLSGWLLCTGIVLFSGSLYILVAGAPTWVGFITPLGGMCLIVGWIMAATSLVRDRADTTH